MQRDWRDFKSLHSNIAGAREAFENACETLFRKVYADQHVSQVAVKQGDGGIDIFIGELGIEPITVIQCKFFLQSFGDSQKSQIRDSFRTASESDKYELKNWILCVPRTIDIDENSWWFGWKNRQVEDHNKDNEFISLKNGNELIDLMKEHDIYNQVFQMEESLKIAEIYEAICKATTLTHTAISNKNASKLIFSPNYVKDGENYYINRVCDDRFNTSLELNNIWLFGMSGVGKTALVNRNLTQNEEIAYHFCDVGSIDISSSKDVLKEILTTLEDELHINRLNNQDNIIRQISYILCKNSKTNVVIVIDELSLSEKELTTKVINDLTKLVTYYSNKSTNKSLKFIISTIAEPNDFLENKPKANEFFEFICCDDWSDDIEKLYNIITLALNINIPESKALILENCQQSPRILKTILRKVFSTDDRSEIMVASLVEKTLKEVV